jgi:hypothetical protein
MKAMWSCNSPSFNGHEQFFECRYGDQLVIDSSSNSIIEAVCRAKHQKMLNSPSEKSIEGKICSMSKFM